MSNSTLNKTEFVAAVAAKAGIPKTEAQKVVKAFIDVVTEALQDGQKVVLTGFGSFEVRQAKERWGVDPRTKEKILIPATQRPAFSAGAELKKAVKGE